MMLFVSLIRLKVVSIFFTSLFFATTLWFDWSFAEFDEFCEIRTALDELEGALLDLVRRLDACGEAKASLALDDARTLDFSSKTSNNAEGVFVGIASYFCIYHR
jgi:hypothetical protein